MLAVLHICLRACPAQRLLSYLAPASLRSHVVSPVRHRVHSPLSEQPAGGSRRARAALPRVIRQSRLRLLEEEEVLLAANFVPVLKRHSADRV